MSMRIRRTGAAGFSLIETVIATTLLFGVVGALLMVTSSGTRTFESGAARSEIETRAHRGLDAILEQFLAATDLELADFSAAPLWSSTVDVEQIADVSVADGTVTTRVVRLAFELETGELDNGIDDNGNGVIDEGLLVATHDVGSDDERRVTLCHWVREFAEGEEGNGLDDDGNGLVDERGLYFSRIDDELTIHLCLERPDSEDRLARTSLESTVWLRN